MKQFKWINNFRDAKENARFMQKLKKLGLPKIIVGTDEITVHLIDDLQAKKFMKLFRERDL